VVDIGQRELQVNVKGDTEYKAYFLYAQNIQPQLINYSRFHSLKSPTSGTGNFIEPMRTSQVGSGRKVSVAKAMKVPGFVCGCNHVTKIEGS
jgi:hypothetical protein